MELGRAGRQFYLASAPRPPRSAGYNPAVLRHTRLQPRSHERPPHSSSDRKNQKGRQDAHIDHAVIFRCLPSRHCVVSYVGAQNQPAAGSDAKTAESIARRIQPVASVEVKDDSDPASLKNGEQVYAAQCVACHGAGVAGAPKPGDNAAWAPRIAQGFQTLVTSALKGKGAMGPQGGGDFNDLEVARAWRS